MALDLRPLGLDAEEVGIYRVFAHRFHWTPATVDRQPVPLIAAFQHDFEAERVRIKMQRDDPDGKYSQVKGKKRILDPRIPLSVRAMSMPIIDSWRRRWNEQHPDETPIPQPLEEHDYGGVVIPGAPGSATP